MVLLLLLLLLLVLNAWQCRQQPAVGQGELTAAPHARRPSASKLGMQCTVLASS
jgi:hypothetical protein